MEILPPFDQIGVEPTPPFVNANPASGIAGSIVNALVFNALQEEIVNVQTAAGLTQNPSDYSQLYQAIRSGALSYYVDTGGVNAPTITPANPAQTALVDGLFYAVRMANAPTGASILHVNSLAAPIVRRGGVACAGGEWAVNDIVSLRYSAAAGAFQISGLVSTDIPNSLPQNVPVHTGTDTGTASAIVCTVSPPITSYGPALYDIKTAVACSGASTANLNGVGSRNVVRADGTPTQLGDWGSGENILLLDDGTNLRLHGVKTSFAPARNLVAQTAHGTYTFTVPAGVTWIYPKVIGAGGGGAGGQGGVSWSGGGGGSGGSAEGWISVTPGQVITYVVGQGGAGAGNSNGAMGGTGGSSSFGSSLTATGGGGGQGGSSTCSGGAPGQGTGGALNLYGSNGGDGNNGTSSVQGGPGAASCLGGGGRTSTVYLSGVSNGFAPGSGGGGIWGSGSGAQNGGNGADGAVYISF